LKVCLDHPQQFDHATRNFREQICRVRVTGFPGNIDASAGCRAELCQRIQ